MRISAKILPLAVAVALWGCQKRTLAPIPQHLSDSLSHASLLTLTHGEGYTLATIADPWHAGHTLQRYVLTDRHRTDSLGELPEGIVIPVPLERAAVFTAAHAQLLCWLHTADKIVGVCDFRYMNIPEMRRQVADGETTDCGDGMAPDVERLRLAAPEAILLSPYEGSNGYGRLTGLGCPIVQCADYMETSPLARAEWMKFYGLLFGRQHEADSLFQVVETAYTTLKDKAKTLGRGASILTERKTGAVWYVPGGQSTTGQLISHANAPYAFADDSHTGSLALSPEQVLMKSDEIAVWAIKRHGGQPLSRTLLASEYDGYKLLRAFQSGQIYECDTKTKPFFEEIAFRPDWLLSDFIIMTHPEENLADTLRYYKLIR